MIKQILGLVCLQEDYLLTLSQPKVAPEGIFGKDQDLAETGAKLKGAIVIFSNFSTAL